MPVSGFDLTNPSGNELVISKPAGGFGAKPGGPKIAWYFDYETGIQPHPTLSRNTSWTGGWSATNAFQTAIKPSGSLGALSFDLNASGNAVGPEDVNVNSDTVLVWVKKMYDFSFAGNTPFNIKSFRAWGFAQSGTNHNTYVGGNNADTAGTADDEGNPRTTTEYVTDALPTSGRYGGWLKAPQNTWVQESIQFYAGTVDTQDAIWHHRRHGLLPWWGASRRWKMRSTGNYAGPLRKWNFDQHSNEGFGVPTRVYHDHAAVDDSWCHVYISAEPTYNTGVEGGTPYMQELQPTTAWGDTAITIAARLGQLALAGKSLYVVTANWTVFRIGGWI